MFDVPWSGGNEVLLATLDEVGMPSRLATSMRKEGVVLVGSFVQLTASDILRRQGLGGKSYREARVTLETLGLSLGMELRGWDEELAREARTALGRVVQRRVFELKPTAWHPHETLESELSALLREVENERNAEMLCVFYGFNSDGPRTLEFTGQPYELTRERVRQISARAERKLRGLWRPLERLEKAAEIINSELGELFTNKDFYLAAQSVGISNIDIHVEGVLAALDIVGEKHSIKKVRIGNIDIFGRPHAISLSKRLLSVLRRETSANGCTNVQRLALLVGLNVDDAERVRNLLLLFPEVQWLDANSTWLLSTRSTRNRLANIAAKVLSVAPSVEINELRGALRRHVRVNFVPPAGALSLLLQHYAIAQMTNNVAVAEENLEQPELGVNDQGILYAFEALGSPVTREQLEDFCIDELGMNVHSFYVYLSYSPFITKLATGVFALVGQDVEPGAISQLKDDIKESRFEDSSGWSKAGTLWWHFQVDRPTAKSGTRSVPTFVLGLTSGEWNIKTIDGLKLGRARIENGFMSGFRDPFSTLGVDKGDYLQIDFDVSKKDVFVRLVGDEPDEFSFTVENDEFDEEVTIEDDTE